VPQDNNIESRTPVIRFNSDDETSGYAEDLDNWILLCEQATLEVCSLAVTIYSVYLRPILLFCVVYCVVLCTVCV
jgi:hypothetical protein